MTILDLLLLTVFLFSNLALNGTNNKISIGELTDLHGPVGSARKQTIMSIYVNLKNALGNIFENAVTGMFLHKSVIALVSAQGPNLQSKKTDT